MLVDPGFLGFVLEAIVSTIAVLIGALDGSAVVVLSLVGSTDVKARPPMSWKQPASESAVRQHSEGAHAPLREIDSEAAIVQAMIIERTENPSWLSNAYLIAEGSGGNGVLVDGNGVVDPLINRVESDGITITHILNTHHHADHVVDNVEYKERFGAPVLAHELTAKSLGGQVDETIRGGDVVRSGDLEIKVIETPGHCKGHLAFLVNDTDCLTADLIFKGTVGGTVDPTGSYDDLRESIMERVLSLPPETRLHPGHREPTTVQAEWDSNPFVRIWRGLDSEGAEICLVAGDEATLVLWAPDYDGGHKAWVRFRNGQNAVVGGSRIERR